MTAYALPDTISRCAYCGVRIADDEQWCLDCKPAVCERCNEGDCEGDNTLCPQCLEEADDERGDCRECHGTGIGKFGRGNCSRCKGSGVVRVPDDPDEFDDDGRDDPDPPCEYDGPYPDCAGEP